MVLVDLVFSPPLSLFKRQRWDFYDPQYYCVWTLLSLLQADKNYRLPMLYPRVWGFSIQMAHAMSQPRQEGGPRQATVSSSITSLCLAFSTHQAQLCLQWHCCLGASLRGAGAVTPSCGTWAFLMWSSAGAMGQWPPGYTLATLSSPMGLLSDHHSSLLYLCLMLFSSSVFYSPFLESHLH